MTSIQNKDNIIPTQEEITPAPVSNNRKNKEKLSSGPYPKPDKRRNGGKPNKIQSTNSGKRTEATFEKKSDSPVLSVFTLLTVFEVHTAFQGILVISKAFYDILHSRDMKMANLFSEDDLTYTLMLCVYYRCATVANRSATKIILGLSTLKSYVEGILLPDVLAQFVETFGRVKLSNGALITPFFDSYDEMKRQPGFVDPVTILRRLGFEPDHKDWGLNVHPVLRYAQASSRALKNAMELRTVNYTELEGRAELLGCFSFSDDGTLSVSALDKIDLKQAQLGAAYRMRISSYIEFGVGVAIQPLFGAPNIRPDMFLTEHILNAWRH